MIEHFDVARIKLALVNYMNSNNPKYVLQDLPNKRGVVLKESINGHVSVIGTVSNKGLRIHFNWTTPNYIRMIILMDARQLNEQSRIKIDQYVFNKLKHKKFWNADELHLFCSIYDKHVSKKISIIEPQYNKRETAFEHLYHLASKWHKKYKDLLNRTLDANTDMSKYNAKLQTYRNKYYMYNVKANKTYNDKYSQPAINLERLSEGCWGLILITMNQAMSLSKDAFRPVIYSQSAKDHSLLNCITKDKSIKKDLHHIVNISNKNGNTINLAKLIESAKKVAKRYNPIFNKLAKFSKQDYLKHQKK